MFTFSEEHFQYLKKQKIEKRWIHFGRISIILLFLLLWELLARLSIINPFLYSFFLIILYYRKIAIILLYNIRVLRSYNLPFYNSLYFDITLYYTIV